MMMILMVAIGSIVTMVVVVLIVVDAVTTIAIGRVGFFGDGLCMMASCHIYLDIELCN